MELLITKADVVGGVGLYHLPYSKNLVYFGQLISNIGLAVIKSAVFISNVLNNFGIVFKHQRSVC